MFVCVCVGGSNYFTFLVSKDKYSLNGFLKSCYNFNF